MEHFELIRQLAGQWNAFSVFLQKYGMYLTAAALVFALLNCFLGYRLRKLWIVLVSFLAGSAVGLAVCIHMRLSLRWSLLAALAAGIFCALLGYLLYRAGLSYPVLGSHCIPPAAASPSGIHGCPGSLPHRRAPPPEALLWPGSG